jgi:hypothetical protein
LAERILRKFTGGDARAPAKNESGFELISAKPFFVTP